MAALATAETLAVSTDGETPTPELKDYKVFVLGGPGSGKTVFLASMFKRLGIQRRKIGFFLSAEADQQNTLIKKYTQLANPSQSWPAATRRAEISEWNFTCAIKASGIVHDVFRFSYLDYAGEFVYDTGQVESDNRLRLLNEAETANSVLVLLDGEKILRHMDHDARFEADGRFDLSTDLDFVLPIVNQLGNKPVHFVVTKWDLLDDRFSLREIRNALLEIDDFHEIVSARRDDECPTRLIPVSALGKGFAQLDQDGRMSKIANARPHPINVEMSIACTLMDHFMITRQELQAIYEQYLQTGLSGFDRWQNRILRKGARALDVIGTVRLPAELGLGIAALGTVVDFINRRLDRDIKTIEGKLEEKYGNIKNREEAVEAVILANQRLIAVLGEDFPESDFNHI